MPDEPVPLGPLTAIAAEALGEPGQRTFRLRAQTDNVAAMLWIEKEQLQALALAIEQLLAQVGKPVSKEQPSALDSFHEPSGIEFKIGRLALGYVEESDLVALLLHTVDDDPEGPASLICLANRPQFKALSRQIVEVCAAGRPRCGLCGDPIDASGHHCVRLN
jgi:uncharacterized repeat protein (TIGR03847 family)